MPATVRSAKVTLNEGSTVPAARPPQVFAGDELWAVHVIEGDSGDLADMTAPAGYTLQGSLDTTAYLVKVWRKTASGGEPATQVFGQPAVTWGSVSLAAVSGASTVFSPNVALQLSLTFGTVTPDVQPAAASHLEIRVAAHITLGDEFTFAAPSGYTLNDQASDGSGSQYAAAAIVSRQINSSVSSGPKTIARDPGNFIITSVGVSISIASADVEPTPDPPPPFTPGLGSGKYQYVVRRLLDRAYLGHLPGLEGVTFERRISTAGTFSGRVPITNATIGDQLDAIIPRDPAELTRGPGVITVEILREGEYWGEYWITGAILSKDRRQPPALELRGSSLEAYLQHVRIRQDIDFANTDQIDIARQLLVSMQGQASADLDLTLQTGTSGQLRDRSYKAADRASYGQRLTELGEVVDGFEWTIDTINGATGLDRSWRWGAPTLGNPDAAHVFGEGTYGGDILSWRIEMDALKGGTHWEARGDTDQSDASVEATPLISTLHASSAHLAAGWPRIDRVIDRPGVTVQQTLEDYAAGWAARKSGAVRVFSVTVAIGAQPSFSPNNLGDIARFVMSDEWHTRAGTGAGLNARHRIIGVRVVPVGRDQGKDEMELTVESSEVT